MSLGFALISALRGLEASQIGLAVSSNNISNAQTPGFTRQRVMLTPAMAVGDRYRTGGGVVVLGTDAPRERLVQTRLRDETSMFANQQMKHQGLSDIETLFNESDGVGMLAAISDFFNSFHNLSLDPTSANARQQVTAAGARLGDLFKSRSNDLLTIQADIDRSMREDVAAVNSLTAQIAAISRQIIETETQQPAHELRDQRTLLVQKLGEFMDVRELESGGEYQVTTAYNLPLVYDDKSMPLSAVMGVDGRTSIRLGIDDLTSGLESGRLAARRDLRDQNIPQYLAALDELAYGIVQKVNAIHAAAYDQDGNLGNNFFVPIAAQAGAARAIDVDPGVEADPRKVAASGQTNGSGNEAAIELGKLINEEIFGDRTAIDKYRELLYSIGSDTAGADVGERQHEALLNQLETRRQEVSGVSIDEETIRILQFQRSFEASARVIQTVNELLELTMSLGR